MGPPYRVTPEMAADATRRTFEQVHELIENVGAGLSFRVKRLKDLMEFKGRKPFANGGEIIYSEPLDFPDVQLRAIHEMNLMDGTYAPARSEISYPADRPTNFSSLERANRLRALLKEAAAEVIGRRGRATTHRKETDDGRLR